MSQYLTAERGISSNHPYEGRKGIKNQEENIIVNSKENQLKLELKSEVLLAFRVRYEKILALEQWGFTLRSAFGWAALSSHQKIFFMIRRHTFFMKH